MKLIKSSITGLVFFLLLIVELTIGFSSLTIANIPRMLLPIKSIKKSLAKFSNIIGDLTVIGFKYIMILIHGNKIQIILNSGLERPCPLNVRAHPRICKMTEPSFPPQAYEKHTVH